MRLNPHVQHLHVILPRKARKNKLQRGKDVFSLSVSSVERIETLSPYLLYCKYFNKRVKPNI